MRSILIAISLLFYSLCGFAQQALTVKQMQQDLDFTYRKLNENHINPYLYISKEKLAARYRTVRKSLTRPLSSLQFYVVVSGLVTALRDGHTLIEPPMSAYNDYSKTNPVFPVPLTINKEGVFAAASVGKLQAGDQILAINGKTCPQLIADFRGLINDVGPLYDIYAKLFNALYWFKYGGSSSFRIQYKHQGKLITTSLSAVPKDQVKIIVAGSDFSFKEINNTTCLLTFNRMFKTKEFDAFLDSTFSVIKNKRIQNLIIDIRKNAGGRGKMADSLFNYLTDKPYQQYTGIKYKITQDLKNLYLSHDPNHTDPVDSAFILSQPNGLVADYLKFNHLDGITMTPHHKANVFKGRTILLTGNQTFSGGAIIAGIFKCSAFGKIVGTEPSQSTKFVADHTYVQLPNSEFDLGISFVELHLPCEQSYYHGIQPDYEVKTQPSDLKAGVDTQMQYALELLQKK